jgi:hypothetical protein
VSKHAPHFQGMSVDVKVIGSALPEGGRTVGTKKVNPKAVMEMYAEIVNAIQTSRAD